MLRSPYIRLILGAAAGLVLVAFLGHVFHIPISGWLAAFIPTFLSMLSAGIGPGRRSQAERPVARAGV